MATPTKIPQKIMVLTMGYDRYIVPAALHDKIHLLLQMQKIGMDTVKVPTGKDDHDWQSCHYFSKEAIQVESILPDYIFKDREAVQKYADEMKKATEARAAMLQREADEAVED